MNGIVCGHFLSHNWSVNTASLLCNADPAEPNIWPSTGVCNIHLDRSAAYPSRSLYTKKCYGKLCARIAQRARCELHHIAPLRITTRTAPRLHACRPNRQGSARHSPRARCCRSPPSQRRARAMTRAGPWVGGDGQQPEPRLRQGQHARRGPQGRQKVPPRPPPRALPPPRRGTGAARRPRRAEASGRQARLAALMRVPGAWRPRVWWRGGGAAGAWSWRGRGGRRTCGWGRRICAWSSSTTP